MRRGCQGTMGSMKRLLPFLVFSLSCVAQTPATAISFLQFRTPAILPASPELMAFLPSGPAGAFILIAIDPAGFSVDTSTTPPTLRATSPSKTSEIFNEVQTPTTATTTLTLAHPTALGPSVKVFRNGIKLSPGNDYSITGAIITLVATQAAQPGDVFNFEYLWQ